MSELPTSAASNPTRLTGAEIVWATLEGEGVRDVFGYPAAPFCPSTTLCASIPSATSWSDTNRARHMPPTATRAPPGRLA